MSFAFTTESGNGTPTGAIIVVVVLVVIMGPVMGQGSHLRSLDIIVDSSQGVMFELLLNT